MSPGGCTSPFKFPRTTVYLYSMSYFLTDYIRESPQILGPNGKSGLVYVLMRDGSFTDFRFLGYMFHDNARFVPGKRVKVRALALCEIENIHSCKPMMEGWYLQGYYVEGGAWPGVFVLCDGHFRPREVFSPPGLSPGRKGLG